MKKFILFTSFFGFLLTPFSFAWAKQNVLQDLTYLQRAGTKLVDLNYRLTLETGQTAEVTFTFSHDNGSTFPVACRSITGDVGKGLTSGYKSAVWDAGVDWPLQFTDLGRIKATCLVTGEDPPPDDDRKPLAFDVVSVPLTSSKINNSPKSWVNEHYEWMIKAKDLSKKPKKYHVGKYEVTNYQWNEVAEWSVSRGYDLKQVSYSPGEENLPRTNVAIKEVIKWLNALSEKQGLTPVYYLDPVEPRWDQNGDGKYSLGVDSWWGGQEEGDWDYQWDPDFDWTLIPNGKKHLTGGWIEFDPNYNGVWDEGEPFYDRNRNKVFDEGIDSLWGGEEEGDYDYQWDPNFDWTLIPNGKENLQGAWIRFDPNNNCKRDAGEPYYDRNRNGKFEPNEFYDIDRDKKLDNGQTVICRNGDLSNIKEDIGFFALILHTKVNATGYRLPGTFLKLAPEFHYLAMGGREESEWGRYHDPKNNDWKQGMVFKDEWSWGAESPDKMADIDEYAITPFGAYSEPQSVGQTKPNGYGLYDMVGNVRELTNAWQTLHYPLFDGDSPPYWWYYFWEYAYNPGNSMIIAAGGSFIHGFEYQDSDRTFPDYPSNPQIFPSRVMNGSNWNDDSDWPSEDGDPDVGFRPVRWTF